MCCASECSLPVSRWDISRANESVTMGRANTFIIVRMKYVMKYGKSVGDTK